VTWRRDGNRRRDRDARHEGARVRLPACPPARARSWRDPGRCRGPGRADHDARCRADRGGGGRWRRRGSAGRGRRSRGRDRGDEPGRGRGRRAFVSGGPAGRGRRDGRHRRHLAHHARDAAAPGRCPQAHGVHGRLGKHPPLRRGGRHLDDVLRRGRSGREPDLCPDHRQRGGRDRGHGQRPDPENRGERDAPRRVDVRRHDSVRDDRARAAGGARLRRAGLPPDRYRRPVDGGARAGGIHQGPSRRHDHRAVRRAGRRRPAGPPQAAGGRREPGRAAGRVARRARHGELRTARQRAGRIPVAQPLPAQSRGDADAHDSGGVRRAWPPRRQEAQRGDGSDRAVRAAQGHLHDRDQGSALLRPGRR
jgi:hypothetical protein